MKSNLLSIKIDSEELNKKPIQIALAFLRNALRRHCGMETKLGYNDRPDLIVEQKTFKSKDLLTESAGYRFKPGRASTPALLEADSTSGAAAGLIYLAEFLAINGVFPPRVDRHPAFDLRLASAVAPLYESESRAVRQALRADGAMQIWDSWTRQIDTEDAPFVDKEALERRLGQFERYADTMVRYGANGIVVSGMNHMIVYRYLGKTPLIGKDNKILHRHRIYSDFFHKLFGMIKERNLLLIIISDQFSYLKEIESWIGPIGAENPRVWQALAAGIQEVFLSFPEIDGIMTRYGQHDASAEYWSEDIFHQKNKPVDTHTWGDYTNRPHDIESLATLIKTVTGTCLERGKLSLFRTWTQTEIDLHSRTDLYRRLVKMLPAEIKQNTVFSIKRTLTDFWYHQSLNPTLSCPGTQRMIELECRHEFEGMGVFPAYWGEDNKSAIQYAVQQGVKHVWFWPDAGGWVTPDFPVILPYVSGFDFWIDANVFQTYRLIADPDENSVKTATDFGTLNLGRKSGKRLAQILQMSYEASSRIFYTLPFAKKVKWKLMSPYWHMPWIGINPEEVDTVLEVTGDSKRELLEESEKGIVWAKRLEQEAGRLIVERKADRTTIEQIQKSAFHLRMLAELMHTFRILICTDNENMDELMRRISKLREILAIYRAESNCILTGGFEQYIKKVEGRMPKL